MMSISLASKLGGYELAQHLKELPGTSALAELPDANTTIWRARDIFRVNVEATEEHAFQTMREATLGRPRTAF